MALVRRCSTCCCCPISRPSLPLRFTCQGGILRGDVVLSAAIGPNGSSLLAGYTNTNSSVVSSTSRDWMAVKLDAAGTARWRWQVHHMLFLDTNTASPRVSSNHTWYVGAYRERGAPRVVLSVPQTQTFWSPGKYKKKGDQIHENCAFIGRPR